VQVISKTIGARIAASEGSGIKKINFISNPFKYVAQ